MVRMVPANWSDSHPHHVRKAAVGSHVVRQGCEPVCGNGQTHSWWGNANQGEQGCDGTRMFDTHAGVMQHIASDLDDLDETFFDSNDQQSLRERMNLG